MRIGIAGYGNLGRALELAARERRDIEIAGVFSRRSEVKTYSSEVFCFDSLLRGREDIDVLVLCYGSSSDLPEYTPELTRLYNTVDTYDNHKHIDDHKARVDAVAKEHKRTSIISAGWDPGLLSLVRLYLGAFIPHCSQNTFWGRGVSQGHSEALRRIPGVIKAIQYTAPRADAISLATLIPHTLDETDRHKRVCYIAAEKGKEDSIRSRVLSMENYFSGYETEIHFLGSDDPIFSKSSPSHRGRIYALGKSGLYGETKHSAHFDLELGSNPDLTANITLVTSLVCKRLSDDGVYGSYTLFDIPPSLFCEVNGENVNKYL